MGEIVSLRKFRKQAKKREEQEQAASNRLRDGRSKAERELKEKTDKKSQAHLDGHKTETGDT